MGHRKNRKRERRNQDWDRPSFQRTEAPGFSPADDRHILTLLGSTGTPERVPANRHCGSCREFIEDQEGGRGTCLHPGSGVLSPWTDTESCAFFQAQRGARADFQRR